MLALMSRMDAVTEVRGSITALTGRPEVWSFISTNWKGNIFQKKCYDISGNKLNTLTDCLPHLVERACNELDLCEDSIWNKAFNPLKEDFVLG